MMINKEFTLINVHIPYAGDIDGTDLSIPYNLIGNMIDLQKEDKIILYCRSGSMSNTAAKQLVDMGYTNVYNLQHGMNEWKQAGNNIVFKNN
jgi:rhodanese-related sulfurtransferase